MQPISDLESLHKACMPACICMMLISITVYFFFSSIEGKLDFSDPTKEASLPKGKKSIFGSNIFIYQLQKA